MFFGFFFFYLVGLFLMFLVVLWLKSWIFELDLVFLFYDIDCKLVNRRQLVIYEVVEYLCVKINFLWDQFVKWRVIVSFCYRFMLG